MDDSRRSIPFSIHQASPIPIQAATFWIMTVLGLLTLLTDLWHAEHWLVIAGPFLTPAMWQSLLAAIFLLTFLTWAWFAFLQSAKYSRAKCQAVYKALYRYILKGSQEESAIIADELTYSMKALVQHAPPIERQSGFATANDEIMELHQIVAHDLLALIADKRFCRVIAGSSPATALSLYQEMVDRHKFDINVKAFY